MYLSCDPFLFLSIVIIDMSNYGYTVMDMNLFVLPIRLHAQLQESITFPTLRLLFTHSCSGHFFCLVWGNLSKILVLQTLNLCMVRHICQEVNVRAWSIAG